MNYTYLHNIGDISMNIEMCESENPPILIKDDPKNIFFNYKDIENYMLRKQVYNMLCFAKSKLPKNYNFYGYETYRPMTKQIKSWNDRIKIIKEQNPNDNEITIIEKAEIFTANPYKEGSGHQTGAAVDLTLCDDNGNLYDMGTGYPDGNSKTKTYSNELTLEQQQNRNILLYAMLQAGFVNYYEEWWHFCYGELEWALITRIGKTKFLKL